MKNRTALLVLLLISGIVYANSLLSGFVWDDRLLVVNKQIFFSHPADAIKIFTSSDAPLAAETPYYRPLNTFTYMVDHYLWGLNPFWYHLENILLHALVTLLFYLLLMNVFEDRRLAFFSALLFAVYPVNSEAVDFISARNTLLCALFCLTSLLFLAKGGLKWSLLSLLAYFLALLSKEPAVVLPFFLLSFGLTAVEEKFKVKKNVLAGFFAITVIYFTIRRLVLGTFTSKSGFGLSLSRLKLISTVYFEHFRLFVFPLHLNAQYVAKSLSFSPLKAAAAALGVLLLLYFSLKKKSPAPVRAGSQWILWGLLPVSNIIKIPSAPVAERYQYTIIMGFVLVLGYVIGKLSRNRSSAAALMGVLTLFLGARTFERNFIWKNDLKLYKSMLRSDPDNEFAHSCLAYFYLENNELGKAASECETAISLNPAKATPRVDLGIVYLRTGDLQNASREFHTALKIAPNSWNVHMNLGLLYMEKNLDGAAEHEFKTAARLNPYFADAHTCLAPLYAARNDLAGAAREFKAALALDPGNAKTRVNLGVIYARMGRLDEAVKEFKTAAAQVPGLPESHLYLGMGYEQEGRLNGAARELRETLKLDPGNAQALEHLNGIESRMEKQ